MECQSEDFDSSRESEQQGSQITLRKRKPRPKVESEWRDEDIIMLIHLIEERRPLWDKESTQYKMPKEFLWRQIEKAFEQKFSLVECKAKWANLRVTFNTNLGKLRGSKNGLVSDEKSTVRWRFFEPMLFLEYPETYRTRQSMSLMDPLGLDTDQPTLTALKLGNGSNSYCKSLPGLRSASTEVDPLVTLTEHPPKNKYTIFGEYIGSELQSLPDYQAEYVKRKLNRVFLDLLDEAALMQAPPPPHMYDFSSNMNTLQPDHRP